MRTLILFIFFGTLVFIGCNNPHELYELSFDAKKPKSVKFYHSQGQYISDCCNWLHFEIDSMDLNKILINGYEPSKVDFWQWGSMVPPEAKDWWHPENLGDSVLYFTKESENSINVIFTTARKNEVYHVHYYK